MRYIYKGLLFTSIFESLVYSNVVFKHIYLFPIIDTDGVTTDNGLYLEENSIIIA